MARRLVESSPASTRRAGPVCSARSAVGRIPPKARAEATIRSAVIRVTIEAAVNPALLRFFQRRIVLLNAAVPVGEHFLLRRRLQRPNDAEAEELRVGVIPDALRK